MNTLSSVPMAPGSVPVIGHALTIVRDPLGFAAGLSAHGDLVRLRLGPSEVLMVCDPELTRQVLVDDRTFDKGGPLFDRSREILGNSLGTCPHSQHRRQRRLCQPAFHRDRLPGYADEMARLAHQGAETWKDGQVVDVGAEMSTLVLRIAARTMFSAGLSQEVVQQVIDDFSNLLHGLFQQTVMPPFFARLPVPANRRFQRSIARLRRTVGTVIADRRSDDVDHGDLLSSLMGAANRDGTSLDMMSDQELVHQVLLFFLAGAETTATTLAWSLYTLTQYPGVEEELRREVDEVVGRDPVAFDHLPGLDLTGRVVTETMRLHTPAWILTRVVTKDVELGGVRVPAGGVVAISPRLVHRRPDLYPQPDRFDPGRWAGAQPDRSSFIPFGGGARKCIGDRFSQIEAALVLAAIVSRWRFTPLSHPPARIPLKNLPTPSLLMRVRRR